MKAGVSEEIKKKVIEEYLKTRRPVKSIAKQNNLLDEQVIKILQEYKDSEPDKFKKVRSFNLKEITDEEIYEQREKNLSYQVIEEYFKNQGKEISWITISQRCKRIYAEKGKEEPKAKQKKHKNFQRSKKISDEEIYEERNKGLTYREIAEHFTEQGRKISRQAVQQRYSSICAKINVKSEKRAEKVLREQILKLKDTKGATDEQIEKIASLYGVKLLDNKDKGER